MLKKISLSALTLGTLSCLSFAVDPVDGDISLTSSAGNPDRAILDITSSQLYPNLAFNLSNSAEGSGSASYSLSGGSYLTNLSDPIGGQVFNGSTNPILGRMDATGLSAGDTRDFTLTADPTSPDLNPVQATHQVQFVNNRQMTWTSDASTYDLGRHRAGSKSINVTLNGGTGIHANSTDIKLLELNSGPTTDFDSGSSAILIKDNTTLDLFNAADQSVDFELQLKRDGQSSRQITLDNPSIETSSSYSPRLIQRSEYLVNESLQITSHTITVDGTSLSERSLNSSTAISGERVMVNQVGTFTGDLVAGVSTYGNDNSHQRLRMLAGSLSEGALTATAAETQLFDSSDDRQDFDLNFSNLAYGTSGTEQVDTSIKGVKDVRVNVDSLVENAELDSSFDGVKPGNVSVGVSFQVVDDRQLSGVDRTEGSAYVALNTKTVNSLTSQILTSNGNNTTHVKLIDQNGGSSNGDQVFQFTDNNPHYSDTFNPGDLQAGGATLGQVAYSGTRNFSIVEEGLVGENAQESVDFSWQLKFVETATASLGGGLSGNGTENLGESGSVSVTHTGPAGTSANTDVLAYAGSAFNLDSTFENLAAGETATFGFSAADDLLAGTHQSRLVVTMTNDINVSRVSGDVASYSFILTKFVAGDQDGTKGRQALLSGSSFGDITVGLTNTTPGSFGSRVGIIDSLVLTEDTEAVISYEEGDLAAGVATGDASSDAVDIKGLDGQIIVIQSNYNEADLIAKHDDESAALLMWWSEEQGQWLNAVAGNSSGDFGPRYEGSYADFLQEFGVLADDGVTKKLSADLLGSFGWDAENDHVWAIVDHNSTFGTGSAVPEPSSAALLLGLVFGSFAILRRRRA